MSTTEEQIKEIEWKKETVRARIKRAEGIELKRAWGRLLIELDLELKDLDRQLMGLRTNIPAND